MFPGKSQAPASLRGRPWPVSSHGTDFRSAVSQVSDLQVAQSAGPAGTFRMLPAGTQRYSGLETCAIFLTLMHPLPVCRTAGRPSLRGAGVLRAGGESWHPARCAPCCSVLKQDTWFSSVRGVGHRRGLTPQRPETPEVVDERPRSGLRPRHCGVALRRRTIWLPGDW
jgi:hypothetical protein